MLHLYGSDPEGFEWIVDSIISLYPAIRDISLYGFSRVIPKCSLLAVAERLRDRAPLLALLKDTNEFRTYFPLIRRDDAARAKLARHVDLKLLNKVVKRAPKNFFKKALVVKHRRALYKELKALHTSEIARLVLGLYQPSPLNARELLASKNYPVVAELSKIFADDFETEIPQLLAQLDKTALVILANMRSVDLDDETRGQVLGALLPIAASGKRREVGLKAFARLYRPPFHHLLADLRFTKAETKLKIAFYARIRVLPPRLLSTFAGSIAGFDGKTVKNALRLAALAPDERTLTIYLAALDAHPALAFEAYLAIAAACAQWNTPAVFRSFAGVMQHSDAEVRKTAIGALAAALRLNTTPIQFLALFALSATDPVDENQAEARRQLEHAIGFRRQIISQLPEPNPAVEPESAIPFVVHLLAHHENFDEDLPELPTFALYLRFFLAPLCADRTDFGRILGIFLSLSLLEDIEEDFTEKLVRLCDLASAIVKELGGGRNWNFSEDPEFEFSARYFKPADGRERIQRLLKQRQRDEPRSPKLESRPVLRAGMSPATKSPRVRRAVLSDDEDEWERKRGKSAPATPMRRSPRIEAREEVPQGTKKQRKGRKASPTMLESRR
jgi:sister-chromatid-cohesion protein PDS5